jgi:DNA-binding response OmpR family regulator
MKRIVIVEDDPSIRDVFEIILKLDGYEVITMARGEALLASEIEAPDLFILDKQLSGLDGLAVCRHVKTQEKYAHVPVIMLSASPNIAELSEHAGADGVIKKPFEMEELREIIARHL